MNCSDKCGSLCTFFACCVGRKLLRKTFFVLPTDNLPCPIELSCCKHVDQVDVPEDDSEFEAELQRDNEEEIPPLELRWRKNFLENEAHEEAMELLASLMRSENVSSDDMALKTQISGNVLQESGGGSMSTEEQHSKTAPTGNEMKFETACRLAQEQVAAHLSNSISTYANVMAQVRIRLENSCSQTAVFAFLLVREKSS